MFVAVTSSTKTPGNSGSNSLIGNQRLFQTALVFHVLELFEGERLFEPEWTGLRTHQRFDMRAAAKGNSELVRDRPHVGAGRAPNTQTRARAVHVKKRQLINRNF